MRPWARIVCDSIGPHGIRLTTMEMMGWQASHPDFMTHRMFSRNAASTRAIPAHIWRDQVIHDPFLPLFWDRNQPGMQGYLGQLDGVDLEIAQTLWNMARRESVNAHRTITEQPEGKGLHKQVANRLLMPFMGILKVVTGIESAWANYFHLRCHHAAQKEEAVQAFAAAEAYFASTPIRMPAGGLHLPYVNQSEVTRWGKEWALRHSSARCARVSYMRQNEVDYEAEERIYARLTNPNTPREYDPEEPVHGSPMEHPAECLEEAEPSGNFVGWRQHRKQVPGEFRQTFSYQDLQQRKADWQEKFGAAP